MMHDAVHWDLSSMTFMELWSEATVLFVAKVLMAASLVAFGPALVLEYVPTKKVDVRDMASAGSKAGRIQRLLLAFAGGGLMAEAALHLLPHLFLPPHDGGAHGDEKHGDHHHGDSRHHEEQGGVDAYTLIAVGFLAAFAIDRFVGARGTEAEGKTVGIDETGAVVYAAVSTAGVGVAAEGDRRCRKVDAVDAGVDDGEGGEEGPPADTLAAAAAGAVAVVEAAGAGAGDDADETVVTTDEAVITADEAVVTADEAIVNADEAVVTADEAVVTADEAVVTADEAVVAADEAVVTADEAVATDTAATAAATAAVTHVANVAAKVAAAATVVGSVDEASSVFAGGDGDNGGGDIDEASPAASAGVENTPVSAAVVDDSRCIAEDKYATEVAVISLEDEPGRDTDSIVSPSAEVPVVTIAVAGAAVSAGEGVPVAVAPAAWGEKEEEEDELTPIELAASISSECENSAPWTGIAGETTTRTPDNSPAAGACTDRAAAFGAPDEASQFDIDNPDNPVENNAVNSTPANTGTEIVGIEARDDHPLAPVGEAGGEPAGPVEPERYVNSTQPSEPAQPVERAESAESAGREEPAEPAESAEPEPVEPRGSMRPGEPADPGEPAEPAAVSESIEPAAVPEPIEHAEPVGPVELVGHASTEPATPTDPVGKPEETSISSLTSGSDGEPITPETLSAAAATSEPTAAESWAHRRNSNSGTIAGEMTGEGDGVEADALATNGTSGYAPVSTNTSDDVITTGHATNTDNTAVRVGDDLVAEDVNGANAAATSPADDPAEDDGSAASPSTTEPAEHVELIEPAAFAEPVEPAQSVESTQPTQPAKLDESRKAAEPAEHAEFAESAESAEPAALEVEPAESPKSDEIAARAEPVGHVEPEKSPESAGPAKSAKPLEHMEPAKVAESAEPAATEGPVEFEEPAGRADPAVSTGSTGTEEEGSSTAISSVDLSEQSIAPEMPSASPACSEPTSTKDLGLTRYGNPRTATGEAAGNSGEMLKADEGATDGTSRRAPAPTSTIGDAANSEHAAVVNSGGDAHSGGGARHDNKHHGDHHDDHHDDHHGDAEAGAYVTLAVDFLHNVIDGIGIGGAYALGGDAAGHATTILKLIHEVQHEIGDVATLVQCGMSKHHAIHIQHTTAGGVFLGVAISLGASAFPEGLLSACLALSAGATFHLASGTILGPVLAIPANVGGATHAFLEVAALAAGAAGVVAVGMAEKWAGLGH